MTITLYYVEGISRTDTPYYASHRNQATLARQAAYFANKAVATITTGFYPPHYTNQIKFTSDDVAFDTNVNYLSLVYNDKTYYYFIDDIEYISEDVIKLYITMDVIQTYMFDIRISSGVIERKFINRWNDDDYTINRNYIRENVSNNVFIQSEYTTYEDATVGSILCMRRTAANTEFQSNYSIYRDNTLLHHGAFAITPTDIVIAPYPAAVFKDVDNVETTIFAHSTLQELGSNAYTWDAYIIPFNPFYNLDYSAGKFTNNGNAGGTWYLELLSDDRTVIGICQKNSADTDVKRTDYYLKDKYTSYSFAFVRNAFLEVDFNASFMPMLLDENYIRYNFGTRATATSFPLHKMNTLTLYNHYIGDIFTGNRYYSILDSNTDYRDIYRTAVVDGNIIGVELLNDQWQNYISNNRSRWASASVRSGLAIIDSIISYSGSSYGKVGKDISQVNKIQYAQARNKKGQFTSKKLRMGSTTTVTERDVYGAIPGSGAQLSSGLLGSMSPLIGQAFEDVNYKFSPDGIKGLTTIGEIAAYEYNIVMWIEKVNDYNQCAHYYHRNGYLVNEYANNISDIFAYVQNRHYFNILKMSLAEIHLDNVIEDVTTLEAIGDRLEGGVRLWNVSASTFTYNNVSDRAIISVDGTYTYNCPYTVNNVFTATAVPVASGSATVVINSHTQNSITYTISGTNGRNFTVSFTGIFYKVYNGATIGDYTYDNVENDFVS